MEQVRFAGDLAYFESLGGDAFASLHLARLKSGPVVIAQTFGAAGTPFAGQLPALVTAADRLKSPKVGTLLAITHIETSPAPALGHQLFSGQLLAGVLERARADGMPLAADLALLIADKVADALTHLPTGCRHHLISTASVLLSYDGDVTVIDVPLSAAFAGQPLTAAVTGAERAARLHKSTLAGQPTPRAEVWQLGAMILEMVSGEPFATQGDIASRVTELCKAQEISADIRDVIERSLVENSEAFRSVEEMKEVVGKLIYQGAYAPSTFNLAFFMHTLYRGEDEKFESRVKSLAAAKMEFPAAAATPPAAAKPAPEPVKPPAAPPRPAAGPAFVGFEGGAQPPEMAAPSGKKSPVPMIAGAAVALLLLAGGGWYMMNRGKSGGDSKKLQEMEARQKALEAENQRLAKETAEYKQQQADLKAREEAQQKLLSESKNAEEKKKAETELAAIEARKTALEEKRRLQEAAALAQQAALAKADVTRLPPSAPAKASAPGSAVAPPPAASAAVAPPPSDESDEEPVVAKPSEPVKEIYSSAEVDQPATMRTEAKPEYPRMGRGSAVVILRLVVDEAGTVVSADVAKAEPGGMGFEAAAKTAVMKSRYAPAIKDGRPVKSFVTKTYKFGA